MQQVRPYINSLQRNDSYMRKMCTESRYKKLQSHHPQVPELQAQPHCR